VDSKERQVPLIDGLVPVPAGTSKARAAKVLPTVGSEDARGMLLVPSLIPDPVVPEAERDYGPDEQLEWVIDIRCGDEIVTTAQIDSAFGRQWSTDSGGVTFYGCSPSEKRWTYLHAGGVPTTWMTVAVSKELVDNHSDDEGGAQSEDSLRHFLRSVESRASVLPKAHVSARGSAAEAASRAHGYFAAWKSANRDVIVVLKAPEGKLFNGKDVWDVMYSLGLEWGDMDLFHWQNDPENRDWQVGDDHFFSVGTTTEPGYFLPEEIAADQVHVSDLIFGFSIPRCGAPREVFEQMSKAARYAQSAAWAELWSARKASPSTGRRSCIESIPFS
jgi:cell division protein ZipA